MFMDTQHDIPLLISHVVDQRVTLDACLIIPAGIELCWCSQCLMDASVQVTSTNVYQRAIVVRTFSISPCLIIRKGNVMLHIPCIIMCGRSHLPVIILLWRPSWLRRYSQSTVFF